MTDRREMAAGEERLVTEALGKIDAETTMNGPLNSEDRILSCDEIIELAREALAADVEYINAVS